MRHSSRRLLERWLTGALLATSIFLAGATFLAPASAQAAQSEKVVARIGHLEIIDPFLPDPASPDVAAAYLTVRNTGSTPDALVSVSSPAAASSMLMTESEHGSVGTMGMLRELRIPAHGQALLVPGHDHLMLEQTRQVFRVGQSVLVTLRFEKAGSITLSVPVVPLSRIIG